MSDYRNQAAEATRARIAGLEAENARLRKRRAEKFADAAPPIVVTLAILLVVGVGFGALRSCSQEMDECAYHCAERGGTCDNTAPSGFACVKRPERWNVPRRSR